MKISVHASQPYAPSLPDSATMSRPATRTPEPAVPVQEQPLTPAPATIEKAWILQAALAVSFESAYLVFFSRQDMDHDGL